MVNREKEYKEPKEILKYKKFVRFEEGAALYSIGKGSFRQLAADAHAVYHIRKIALVNVEKIDRFLEENCCDYLDGIEEDAYDPLVKAGKRTQKYNFQEGKLDGI